MAEREIVLARKCLRSLAGCKRKAFLIRKCFLGEERKKKTTTKSEIRE